MSLVARGGKIDPRFNIINAMQDMGWTYQEWLQRPLWFDAVYAIKLKADAKYHEINSRPPKSDTNG